jgi:hypothetical protein
MSEWRPATTITEAPDSFTGQPGIFPRVVADAVPERDITPDLSRLVGTETVPASVPPHAVAAWTKPAGRRSARARRRPEPQRVVPRYPTGEQRECEPCAAAGRTRMGVTRSPGLVACKRCWLLHERAGIWPSRQHPHDVDACRLCRPSVEPDDEDAAAPMLGSLLPYNPVDRPLAASRPALGDPWQVVALAQQFADDHADTGRPLRLGHDFGRVEVAVTEVYAALTATYGPVVRPSVREVHARVGCSERRAQYALRALQRAGLLYQHADGCVVRGEDGQAERLAAEYELRIPLAHVDRGQLMEELDEAVDRERLDLYLDAVEQVRAWTSSPAPAEQVEENTQAGAPVDGHCTPVLGLLSLGGSRSSDTLPDEDREEILTEEGGSARSSKCSGSPSVERPRTARGYALARKLCERAPRWLVVPLPVLAAELLPLANLGWSAYRVDRATETYGPVTSSSGLTRTLRAVVDHVTQAPTRRYQARVNALAARIINTSADAHRRAEAVWTDTSEAARAAYALATAARHRPDSPTESSGWATLRALTDPPPGSPVTPAADPVPAPELTAAQRSAVILARARQRAAAERAGRRA